MAELWKPQSFDVLQSWIVAIIDEAGDELTDWESKFVDDMSIRVAKKQQLTRTQEEKLESIYAEKTS